MVLYCPGGLAADELRHMGCTNVISRGGGWRAYNGREAGGGVMEGSPAAAFEPAIAIGREYAVGERAA